MKYYDNFNDIYKVFCLLLKKLLIFIIFEFSNWKINSYPKIIYLHFNNFMGWEYILIVHFNILIILILLTDHVYQFILN